MSADSAWKRSVIHQHLIDSLLIIIFYSVCLSKFYNTLFHSWESCQKSLLWRRRFNLDRVTFIHMLQIGHSYLDISMFWIYNVLFLDYEIWTRTSSQVFTKLNVDLTSLSYRLNFDSCMNNRIVIWLQKPRNKIEPLITNIQRL